jgi:hypothetical protein
MNIEMKLYLTFFLFILTNAMTTSAQTGQIFEQYFLEKTMRLDYFHTGTKDYDIFSKDEIYQEPIWAGSKINLIDTLNLGKYIFKVIDLLTQELLYSRGFCSIFGEWQTTEEALNGEYRTFSESIRFPWPKKTVQVTISQRDTLNIFQKKWSVVIDPEEHNIRKTKFYAETKIKKLLYNGNSCTKVDLVILPDGYRKNEMKKFLKDTKRLLKIFFEISPFKERKKDFNIWAVQISSKDKGIDNPQKGQYKDNVLSCSYNSFGTDRYILTYDNKTIRKIASLVPYDHLYILVNSGKYGGGGIFNLYAISVSDSRWSDYIFVHEFGHSFAGLGDEYYTSETAYTDFYPEGIEPWEPNITALLDKNQLKWQDLIEPDMQIPTPWAKYTFDNQQNKFRKIRKEMIKKQLPQSQIDSAIAVNDLWVQDYLRKQTHIGKTGAFEGSGYISKGLYRPSLDCTMFTRSLTGFDPVCSRAIERVIDFYSQ